MIVWLASYPRSGNTFLRMLLKTYFDLSTYSKYNDKADIGAKDGFSKLVGHQSFEGQWSGFYQAAKDSVKINLIKTHDGPEDDEKAIYLIRDGRASAVSYKNYLSHYSKLNCDLSDVITGSVNFGSWSDHVKAWDPQNRPNTLLLKFEDLVDDVEGTVKKLSKFLEMPAQKGSLPSFEELKKQYPKFFKTGSNQRNIERISSDQMAYLNYVAGDVLAKYGYVKNAPLDQEALVRIQKVQSAKLLRLRREIVALTDTESSSKLEAQLVEIKGQIAEIVEENRHDRSEMQLQQSSLRDDLVAKMTDLRAELGKHQKSNMELSSREAKRSVKVIQQSFADLEDLLNAKATRVDLVELKEKIDQFDSLSASVLQLEGTIISNIGRQEKTNKREFSVLKKDLVAQGALFKKSLLKLESSFSEIAVKQFANLDTQLATMGVDLNEQVEKLGQKLSRSTAGATKSRRLNQIKNDEKWKENTQRLASLEVIPGLIEAMGDQNSKELRSQVRSLRARISAQTDEFEATLEALKQALLAKITDESKHKDFVKRTDDFIAELKSQNQHLLEVSSGLQNQFDDEQLKTDRLKESVVRFASTHDEMRKKVFEMEQVLEPRFRSLLELRPWRHIFAARKRLKLEGGEANPDIYASSSEIISQAERSVKVRRKSVVNPLRIFGKAKASLLAAASNEGAYVIETPGGGRKESMGIAVFTHDRKDLVHNVLESLAQQNALGMAHVWIDGDQGKPDKRKILDETEALVRTYDVKKIHRNRGNFGFRKMMIMAQRYMLQRYENIIFLEDDCFPVRNAVSEFKRELDVVRDDPKIFSVYGHPFLVPGEGKGFGRFQGWGWATTSEKLLPVWSQLLELYLKTEEEYLAEVERVLTPQVVKKIDVTPGRQPTSTIKNFFAWDEALCMLAGMDGLSHKMSDKRLIYNCGAGDSSAHFTKIDYYRKPPFNMIAADEVWDYF
jgi:hypothetical protein